MKHLGKKNFFFKAGLNSCPAPFVGCGSSGKASFSFKPQCLPLPKGAEGALVKHPARFHACEGQAVVVPASASTTPEGCSEGALEFYHLGPTCRCRMKGKGGSVRSSFHFCPPGKALPPHHTWEGQEFQLICGRGSWCGPQFPSPLWS